MHYKTKIKQKKISNFYCTPLNSWIIKTFLKYSKEYYIVPNTFSSPYLYSYTKLKNIIKNLHHAKISNKNT